MDLVTQRSLGPFAAAWDSLVARQPHPSPFLRTWWLDATAIGEPVFVLLLEDSRLIGGLALQQSGRLGLDIVEMMGQGPLEPDHLDLIAEPGREAAVVDAVRVWLTRRGPRILDLDGIEPDGLLVAALPRPYEVIRRHVARAFRLPVDLDGWLGDQPRVVRNQVRPTGRRLDRDGIVFRRVPVEETDEATTLLRDLHVERFEGETAIPAHWAALERAVRAGARRGEAAHFQLRDGDEVGVASLHFDLGGRRHYYQSGRLTDARKWRGAGSVLLWRVMQDATENGIFELDHLRGDELYKAQWSNTERSLVHVRCGIGMGRAALSAARTWRNLQNRRAGTTDEPTSA
jgi:CelD/BcsL family acetyltransferase involved in cellulose biosynthesis